MRVFTRTKGKSDMIGARLERMKDLWGAFWDPVIPDERQAARNVWEQLPEDLQVPDQTLGRHSAGCAATYGVMEACDFKCTAC